jgi:hypothetical protein
MKDATTTPKPRSDRDYAIESELASLGGARLSMLEACCDQVQSVRVALFNVPLSLRQSPLWLTIVARGDTAERRQGMNSRR